MGAKALTKRDREFLKMYRKFGGDTGKIANAMGIKQGSVLHYLEKPLVKRDITRNLDYCREVLNAAAPLVLAELQKLMFDSTVPAGVRAQIGAGLLDRAGLAAPKAPLVQVNVNTAIADRAREILASRINSGAETIDITPEQEPSGPA